MHEMAEGVNVAVNFSPQAIPPAHVLSDVRYALRGSSGLARRIGSKIEITESSAVCAIRN